jgi:DNA-binding response OmpR family regulator
MKILVIDDDREILDSLKMMFNMCWPEAEIAMTRLGEDGIKMVRKFSPDEVILDLGLPDIEGFEVLKQIRQISDVPVIILTVRGDETDVVRGLGLGADDYLVKPFRHMELIARLQVIIRKQNIPIGTTMFTRGPVRLDVSKQLLVINGITTTLTKNETIIFLELIRRVNKVVTYNELAVALWGKNYPGSYEAIRVYIKRLRDKLKEDPDNPEYIFTKSGQGYFLNQNF